MCGIFGFVGRRTRAESIDLGVAIQSMHHRGPDDNGTYFGVSQFDPDVACAFAHTRLSIIDLSAAGHQPLTTADGRYTIVYNGEVYNFLELRRELENAGELFRSKCDTEVILKAYARWGCDCVNRLRGMFAFAIWDEVNGTLFLARDRFGIKPLYYVHSQNGLAFASELRCLLATGISPREASPIGLFCYLNDGAVYDPLTILKSTYALLPSHTLTSTRGAQPLLKRYWTPPAVVRERNITEDIAAEILRPVLRDAVRRHLVADVPIGVFLSGGVDSSALVALAAREMGDHLHTFTLTFAETEYDEGAFASTVAGQFHTNHHQVQLSASDALGQFDNIIASLDQPSADGVNTYFVAQAARHAGLVVALSGLGGDEVFAGYQNFLAFGALLKLGGFAPAGLAGTGLLALDQIRRLPVRVSKFASILGRADSPASVYHVLRSVFPDSDVRRFVKSADDATGACFVQALAPAYAVGDAVNMFSALELANYMRNTLLRDSDVMGMAHSLEIRVPLIDNDLTEDVLSFPGALKTAAGTSKRLLRKAAGMTDEARVKKGFLLPLSRWFRNEWRDRVEGLLRDLGRHEILGGDVTAPVWHSFLRSGEPILVSRVWCLAALSGWSATNRVALT
jgi:asparagine synthase (glutamine-hydrolysing)